MLNNYNVSNSSEANQWKAVLENQISKRIESAQNVIETVQGQIIKDVVARAKSLNFSANVTDAELDRAKVIMHLPNSTQTTLHTNAVQQLAQKSDMPKRFIDSLVGQGVWGAELIAHNLNEILHHGNGEKYLIRSIGNETRGVLSDRYRRIDSRPLVEAFAQECQNLGVVPIEGYALDTTVRLRALLPMIFEPYPGEFIAFGLEWKNSDFGVGGNEVKFFMLRPVCLNGATRESLLRQIHTGGKISDDIIYSQETYRLDTMLNVSKLRDIVRFALAPANVDAQVQSIRDAHEMKVDPKKAKELLEARLSKADAAEVQEAYTSADIEMMPAGNSIYRLSNALSWVANLKSSNDVEGALELQQMAGEILPKVKLITN